MNANTCKTCKHLRQHYVRRSRGYAWTNCGHCVYPRLKLRRPDTTACDKFRPACHALLNTDLHQ